MKRIPILIINQYFWPYNIVGANRTTKFVKFLPDYGIIPVVHTSFRAKFKGLDYSTCLPEQVVIYRKPWRFETTENLSIYEKRHKFTVKIKLIVKDIVFSPDKYIWWYMTSIPSLFRIIRNWNIRIIYASGDPFSSLVTAILLKKITKIPVILDFRDPWKDNINCTKQSLYRRKVCASLEAFCVRNSDAVLATTSKLLEALKQYSGNVIFRVIQNGFDDEDFVLQIKSCEKKEEFNFLYTGKYSIDSPDYNPVSLIKAFRLFREKKTIAKAKLVLIGRTDDKTINSLKSLENMGIYCHNIMPKDQLSKFLSNADCFIHFYYPNIYSDTISTKMFEYAYYLKPILSFSSNDGEIERFLTELQIGSCTSSHNEDKMANLLLKAYENQIVVNMKFAEKNIHKYHFRNRTSELADLIKTIVT